MEIELTEYRRLRINQTSDPAVITLSLVIMILIKMKKVSTSHFQMMMIMKTITLNGFRKE